MLTESDKNNFAVADAMMATQGYFLDVRNLDKQWDWHLKYDDPVDKIEDILQYRSKINCTEGSLFAITQLAKYHRDRFRYLFLMTLDNRRGPDWDEGLMNGLDYHTVFLAQTNDDNVWFTGSPANFKMNEASLMTDLISNRDLACIVEAIEKGTPGPWPDAEIIMDKLEYYEDPIVIEKLPFALYHSHLQRREDADLFEFTHKLRPWDPKKI